MSTLKIEYLIKVDIKAIRIGKGLTLRAMSRKIGMDASNYSKMERGKASIDEITYEKFLRVKRVNKGK